MTERIRVGTRQSPLARIQTQAVLDRLGRSAKHLCFESVPIETSGDRDRSTRSSPDFTDAIDRALLRGEVDLGVHSAKDLPVELDPRLALAACPRRADPRDCLVVGAALRRGPLPAGTTVGSSSPRRRAQLLRWRPDLKVLEIRGNVDTRVALVRSGRIDAAILAVAGLSRLGRAEEIEWVLPSTDFLPAPAQGALAVVARAGDRGLREIARGIDHTATHACVVAERRFTAA
ncbi:MAG: hydroxymethylbilane synthase, partial [Thermoplasmata archaeon]